MNRRDGRALQLSDADVEFYQQLNGAHSVSDLDPSPATKALLETLRTDGFLTDRPADLDHPSERMTKGQRVARLLRTLDVHWRGADRLVRAAYAGGLHVAFRPAALAAQLVLALAGILALIAAGSGGAGLHLRASPTDVPALLAMGLVAVAVHELGHALVLVHYGGSVHSAGLRLHLGTPAFYVDSVDALLLSRRQRMLQAAAGPWAEWLVTSSVALLVWRSPAFFLAPLLYRFVIVNSITIASNLIPFVGLDGYLLLADAVREPDLDRRSRSAVLRASERLRVGRAPTLEDAVLGTYAAVNALVAAGLLALATFFWYQLFGSSVTSLLAFGPVGWLVLTGVSAALLRPVLMAGRPGGIALVRSCRRLEQRLQFRLERRWRVDATERLRRLPELAGMGTRGLGVVAGGIERLSLPAGSLLHRPEFRGLVLVNSAEAVVHGELRVAFGHRVSVVLAPDSLLATARAAEGARRSST